MYFKEYKIEMGLRQCFYPPVVGVNMLGKEEARTEGAVPPPHLFRSLWCTLLWHLVLSSVT